MDFIARDDDFAFLLQILDAAVFQAVADRALDLGFGAAQESLAVDQAFPAGVQATIDNMHVPRLAPFRFNPPV